MQHRILVLRPYGPRIRDRMFAALERIDLRPGDDDIVPSGLSDDEVLKRLTSEDTRVFLCPYNNIKLPDGGLTNGLRLVQRIEQEMDRFASAPILMPVSVFSAPVFHLQLRGGTDLGPVSEGLRQRLLEIEETELDAPDTLAAKIGAHLEAQSMAD